MVFNTMSAARGRFLSIIDEVSCGKVLKKSVDYLVIHRDEDDIKDVIVAAIKAQMAPKTGRRLKFGKHWSSSILITAIIQRKLEMSYDLAKDLVITLLRWLIRDHLSFSCRLLSDLLTLSNEPSWPGASFLLRLFIKTLISFLMNNYPDAQGKRKVFAVKTLYEVAASIKYREATLKDEITEIRSSCGDDFCRLSSIVFGFLEGEKFNELNENAGAAYGQLWRDSNIEYHSPYEIRTRADARAALCIISSIKYFEHFIRYVKFILRAATSETRGIKSQASKCIAKLLILDPTILDQPNTVAVLDDCLKNSDAKALASLITMLYQYLVTCPTEYNNNIFISRLVGFFKHPSLMVRKASVEGAAHLLFNLPEHSHRDALAFQALARIEDEEAVIQQAVCQFFYNVYCGFNCSFGLVSAAMHFQQVPYFVTKIITQCDSARKACQSQVHTASQVDDTRNFDNFCASLSEHVRSTKNEAKLIAAIVLEAVAKVLPANVGVQADLIVDVFCQCTQENSELLRTISRVLILIKSEVSAKNVGLLTKHAGFIINNDIHFLMSTVDFTTLLHVFLEFLGENNRQIAESVQLSLNVLRQHQSLDDKDEYKVDVKRALCSVIYLWKKYDDDVTVHKMIDSYLMNGKYNLTVLQALCQSRLIYIPTCDNKYLYGCIVNYLKKVPSVPLACTALYFICCTLIGYNNEYKKPDMKEVGDPTTETVSQLLQLTLPHVLQCTLSPELAIRTNAAKCIEAISQSGLIMMNRIIPHIVAMTTDPVTSIRQLATSLLTAAAESWHVTSDLFSGIKYAYELASNLHPGMAVRGFPESSCHVPFELVQNKPENVKNITDTILRHLGTASPGLVVFAIDQILHFPYKSVGLVNHALHSLEMYLSNSTESIHVNLLKRAEEYFEIAYKTALKIAAKSKHGREAAVRNDTVNDYITPEISSALNDPSTLLTLLMPAEDIDENRQRPKKKSGSKITDNAELNRSNRRTSLIDTIPVAANPIDQSEGERKKKRRSKALEQEPVPNSRRKSNSPSDEIPIDTIPVAANPIDQSEGEWPIKKRRSKALEQEPVPNRRRKSNSPSDEIPIDTFPVAANPIDQSEGERPRKKRRSKTLEQEPVPNRRRKSSSPSDEIPLAYLAASVDKNQIQKKRRSKNVEETPLSVRNRPRRCSVLKVNVVIVDPTDPSDAESEENSPNRYRKSNSSDNIPVVPSEPEPAQNLLCKSNSPTNQRVDKIIHNQVVSGEGNRSRKKRRCNTIDSEPKPAQNDLWKSNSPTDKIPVVQQETSDEEITENVPTKKNRRTKKKRVSKRQSAPKRRSSMLRDVTPSNTIGTPRRAANDDGVYVLKEMTQEQLLSKRLVIKLVKVDKMQFKKPFGVDTGKCEKASPDLCWDDVQFQQKFVDCFKNCGMSLENTETCPPAVVRMEGTGPSDSSNERIMDASGEELVREEGEVLIDQEVVIPEDQYQQNHDIQENLNISESTSSERTESIEVKEEQLRSQLSNRLHNITVQGVEENDSPSIFVADISHVGASTENNEFQRLEMDWMEEPARMLEEDADLLRHSIKNERISSQSSKGSIESQGSGCAKDKIIKLRDDITPENSRREESALGDIKLERFSSQSSNESLRTQRNVLVAANDCSLVLKRCDSDVTSDPIRVPDNLTTNSNLILQREDDSDQLTPFKSSPHSLEDDPEDNIFYLLGLNEKQQIVSSGEDESSRQVPDSNKIRTCIYPNTSWLSDPLPANQQMRNANDHAELHSSIKQTFPQQQWSGAVPYEPRLFEPNSQESMVTIPSSGKLRTTLLNFVATPNSPTSDSSELIMATNSLSSCYDNNSQLKPAENWLFTTGNKEQNVPSHSSSYHIPLTALGARLKARSQNSQVKPEFHSQEYMVNELFDGTH